MTAASFEITIYQLADDALLKRHRRDGSGWDWSWAPRQRDWMDATPNRYAYRCLPLSIVNQTGWWVYNPIGFTALWHGGSQPGSIDFWFDNAPELWSVWINNQFGEGIITWNTPFLFRTRPNGSRLLVLGPVNYFKHNLHPLTALIESDWMSMSFTMNWKVMRPQEPIRFNVGEPLFQTIPLAGNTCADLEGAVVRYCRLAEDAEVARSYHQWRQARDQFHQDKASGQVRVDDWQKDYFHGQDVEGRLRAPDHRTKVVPPAIHFSPTTAGNAPEKLA